MVLSNDDHDNDAWLIDKTFPFLLRKAVETWILASVFSVGLCQANLCDPGTGLEDIMSRRRCWTIPTHVYKSLDHRGTCLESCDSN